MSGIIITKGSRIERTSNIVLGAGISISQNAEGVPVLDTIGDATFTSLSTSEITGGPSFASVPSFPTLAADDLLKVDGSGNLANSGVAVNNQTGQAAWNVVVLTTTPTNLQDGDFWIEHNGSQVFLKSYVAVGGEGTETERSVEMT